MLYFLPLYFVKQLHFSAITIGILMSTYGLGLALGGTISGKLSDHYSTRSISTIFTALKGTTYFLLILTTSNIVIAATLCIMGTSANAIKTTTHLNAIYSRNTVKISRIKVLNILRMAANAGVGLAGIIFAGLWQHHFTELFFSIGLLMTIAGPYLSLNQRAILNKHFPADTSHARTRPPRHTNTSAAIYAIGCIFLIGIITAQLHTT
jgi:MFS family permease